MKIPRCNARVDKRFEAYCSLQFVQRGTVELFYDDTRYLVQAPAFWTCYPETSIRFHGYRGGTWHHRYVAIRGTGSLHLRRSGLFFLGIQPCPVRESSRCAALMDRIIGLIQSPGSLSGLRAGNLLEQLLIDIAEWRQLQPRSEPWLDALMSSLESSDDFRSDYSLIARRLGMALSTFRRCFRQKVGISLHRYTLELRMSKARRLVGTTDIPLKNIAEQLGYENPFYFSRQFHQFYGVPPGVYRHSRQV